MDGNRQGGQSRMGGMKNSLGDKIKENPRKKTQKTDTYLAVKKKIKKVYFTTVETLLS